jgi:phosphatidate cytidylyltransferase
LSDRIIVTLFLLPAGLWLISVGGWPCALLIAGILALAALEYGQLFQRLGFRPSAPLLVVGVAVLVVSRLAWGEKVTPLLLTLVSLAAMTWHLVDFEQGASHSGTDFAFTLAGTVYLGWVGGYLVALRQLPDGAWWLLVSLAVIWLADSGAFLVGRAWGRHHMSPRLSPRKTWEGYVAGVATGALCGAGLGALLHFVASPGSAMGALSGLVLGGAISAVAPLGDLGISMMKREVKVKDTGSLLPGHGGLLDRVDSWLWAGALGYYLVLVLS